MAKTKKKTSRKVASKNAPKRAKTAKAVGAAKKAKKARSKPASVTVAAEADAHSLGRPKVTQDEKLYMLFKEDYHARQIFDFLRVATVKELEQFGPGDILRRLSEPIRQTVDRIRKKLAEKNRSLAGDEEFAKKYKAE